MQLSSSYRLFHKENKVDDGQQVASGGDPEDPVEPDLLKGQPAHRTRDGRGQRHGHGGETQTLGLKKCVKRFRYSYRFIFTLTVNIKIIISSEIVNWC